MATAANDAHGKLYVAIPDMTERIRMEKALETTEACYATLFNSTNDIALVFTVTDSEEPGNFVQVNQVACETLGFTREELLQRSIRDLHRPEELSAQLALRKAISFASPRVFETVFLTRDGRSIPVEISARMISLDGSRAVPGMRIPNQPGCLKSIVMNPQVPVIAVTASAMAGDRDKCIALGMDDYLPKPIEPEDLLNMLDKWLIRSTEDRPRVKPAEVPPATQASPVFDYNALLKRLVGNRPAVHKVTQAFLEAAPSQLAHLREHLAARDAAAARRDAHTLKGSAATVSALALRDVALAVEQAASAGSWDIIEKLIPEMEEQLKRLAQAIALAGGDHDRGRAG